MAWIRQKAEPEQGSTPRKPYQQEEAPRATAPAPRRESTMEALVNIGQSVEIKGTLTGNEDLVINGRVNGEVMLDGHTLTIGPNGKIEAGLTAKSVIVEGQVNGNISAKDKIQITSSGTVKGDLSAPRIALDDGAHFAGHVDTGTAESASGSKASEPATAAVPASHS